MKAVLLATLGLAVVTSFALTSQAARGPQPSQAFGPYVGHAEQALASYKQVSQECMQNGPQYFASCMNGMGAQSKESFDGWYVAISGYSGQMSSDDVVLQRQFMSDADSMLLQLDQTLSAAGQPPVQIQPSQQPQPPVQYQPVPSPYQPAPYPAPYPGQYPYPYGGVIIIQPGYVVTTTTVTTEEDDYTYTYEESGGAVHHRPHPKPQPPPCGCHR